MCSPRHIALGYSIPRLKLEMLIADVHNWKAPELRMFMLKDLTVDWLLSGYDIETLYTLLGREIFLGVHYWFMMLPITEDGWDSIESWSDIGFPHLGWEDGDHEDRKQLVIFKLRCIIATKLYRACIDCAGIISI